MIHGFKHINKFPACLNFHVLLFAVLIVCIVKHLKKEKKSRANFLVILLLLLNNKMYIIFSGIFTSPTAWHVHTGLKSPTDP